MKFDWNDIALVPSVLSSISTRKEVEVKYKDGKLPLFTAPMDKVIDQSNVDFFENEGVNICLPRHVKFSELKNENYFYSYGLDEIIEIFENDGQLPKKVLIDIAQGHMFKLWEISKRIKEKFGNSIELMIGNIANPDTYRKYCEIGVDYIRVGIGGGSVCTTSANVSIHYPMASLVSECNEIKKEFKNPTKIVADGGFKNFSDIIKALALGSDYVMLGGIFNKCLESCSDNFILNGEDFHQIDLQEAIIKFEKGFPIYKYYRGMSTKEVQKSWNKEVLKTGEGVSRYNKVEHKLEGWVENFVDYLKSAMSYCDSRTLEQFIGQVNFEMITQNSFMRFNK
jgi:hypothetical protein